MQGRLSGRGSRLLALAGLVVYSLFLVTVQFEHHDLICHAKHPAHCPACSSSVLGADPDAPTTLGVATLPEVGRAVILHTTPDSALLPSGPPVDLLPRALIRRSGEGQPRLMARCCAEEDAGKVRYCPWGAGFGAAAHRYLRGPAHRPFDRRSISFDATEAVKQQCDVG